MVKKLTISDDEASTDNESVIEEVIRLDNINLKYLLQQKYIKEFREPFIADTRITEVLVPVIFGECETNYKFKDDRIVDGVSGISISCTVHNVNGIPIYYFHISVIDNNYEDVYSDVYYSKYKNCCDTLEEVIEQVICIQGINEDDWFSVLYSDNDRWHLSEKAKNLYTVRKNEANDKTYSGKTRICK